MPDLGKMNALINDLCDAPFEFGVNDCYVFTAKLVKEWHGKDYLSAHSVYKNEAQAKAYIENNGGIAALTTSTLGKSFLPELCEDGDVVVAEVSKNEWALGFVFRGFGWFKGKRKQVFRIPLNKCLHGWRVK